MSSPQAGGGVTLLHLLVKQRLDGFKTPRAKDGPHLVYQSFLKAHSFQQIAQGCGLCEALEHIIRSKVGFLEVLV